MSDIDWKTRAEQAERDVDRLRREIAAAREMIDRAVRLEGDVFRQRDDALIQLDSALADRGSLRLALATAERERDEAVAFADRSNTRLNEIAADRDTALAQLRAMREACEREREGAVLLRDAQGCGPGAVEVRSMCVAIIKAVERIEAATPRDAVEADAHAIVAAVNALPALLTELDRLRAIEAAVEKQRDAWGALQHARMEMRPTASAREAFTNAVLDTHAAYLAARKDGAK